MKMVRITKLKATESPHYPTPCREEYIPGLDNGFVSLPVDYTVVGSIEDVVVGRSVFMLRTERNGVKCGGVFSTSKVQSITETGFTTLNSVYLLEEL